MSKPKDQDEKPTPETEPQWPGDKTLKPDDSDTDTKIPTVI